MKNINLDNGWVKQTIEKGVSYIEFGHPKSNSLPSKILNSLAENITEAGSNSEVKIIFLKSSGDRAFCAGASFEELLAIKNFEEGKLFFSGFSQVINAVRKCPKFVVGRVQGKAVGGGVGIASAVDLCYANKYAQVKLSELALGIGPFVVGPAVSRRIGNNSFSEMAINPERWYSSDWALRNKLFSKVFETNEAMDKFIEDQLNVLKTYSLEAMSELKKVFWEGTDHWDELLSKRAEISGKLVTSAFTRSFINKFKSS